MNYSEILSQILIIVAIIVAFVNIITEVVKKIWAFKSAESINIFVTILSIILTMGTFLAYWQIKELQITWYIIVSFIIVGFMVAYAAMFGFDKLIKYFEKVSSK